MEEDGKDKFHERFINLFGFFMFGFTEYVIFAALLTGSQDILANTQIPTTVTILFADGPFLLLSLVCPYFISTLSPLARITGTVICFIFGILVVALARNMWWKLTGLSVTSVGYFFVEAGLLPLTAFYSEKTVFAFSGGTGFGLVGTVYYTVLTTSACVSPRDTLLSAVWLPLIYPAVFYFMDKKLSPSTDHAPYTPLSHTPYSTSGAPDTTPEESLTGVEKLHIVKSLFVYATLA